MTIQLTMTSVKDSAINAYRLIASRTNEWMGRAIVILKSGRDSVVPYLQDSRIAVVSLVFFTLFAFQLGDKVYDLCESRLPRKQPIWEAISSLTGISVIVGSIAGFSRVAQLPLSRLAIAGTAIGTIMLRIFMSIGGDE